MLRKYVPKNTNDLEILLARSSTKSSLYSIPIIFRAIFSFVMLDLTDFFFSLIPRIVDISERRKHDIVGCAQQRKPMLRIIYTVDARQFENISSHRCRRIDRYQWMLQKNILCLASRNARQVTEIQCLLSTEFESMTFF